MSLRDKIKQKSVHSVEHDCIIWTGFVVKNNTRNTTGIAYIWDNSVKPRKMINVPRFLLEQKLKRNLKIIHFALHICDNIHGPCVNEDHLYEGTQYQNNIDKFSRGRDYIQQGEVHHSAKLLNEDIELIHLLLEEGFMQKDIAKIFKVDPSHISNIKCGRIRITA